MSIPAQPTSTSIVNEAWKLLGKSSPTSAETTRAIDYGLEFVKGELMDMGKEWDFLRTTYYIPCTVGVSSYQVPTDFSKFIKASLLDGTRRGTAQSATSTTITLASSDAGLSGSTVGKWIVITSATAGANQALQIKSYDSSTKVATLETTWPTTPTGTIVYLVVDSRRKLTDHPIDVWQNVTLPHQSGMADNIFHEADSTEGDLILDKVPDKIYVIELRYYANLLKVDLAVTLYNTILRLLNHLFIQGVFVWSLQDDTRYQVELQKFERMKARAGARHLYPLNLSNISSTLEYE